jgi:hypothetical protein
MADKNDFAVVFQKLRAILEPYAPKLVVTSNTKDHYYLDTRHVMKNKQPLCFAAARVGKSYVSFYLMPVYVYPDLLDGASPELKKRMQGKSCFNFKSVDDKLFKELARLTKAGFARYKTAKYV